jgi:tryptophan synthase alpha chain
MNLESHLRERRAQGRKLLVPYVTGGSGGSGASRRAVVGARRRRGRGRDPFSDPIMDGRTIRRRANALDLGATPISVIDEMAGSMSRSRRSS